MVRFKLVVTWGVFVLALFGTMGPDGPTVALMLLLPLLPLLFPTANKVWVGAVVDCWRVTTAVTVGWAGRVGPVTLDRAALDTTG